MVTASHVRQLLHALEEGKARGETANQVATRFPGNYHGNIQWLMPSAWKPGRKNDLPSRLSRMRDYPEHRAAIEASLHRMGIYGQSLPEPRGTGSHLTAEDMVRVLRALRDRHAVPAAERGPGGIMNHVGQLTGFHPRTLSSWFRLDGSLKLPARNLTQLVGYFEHRGELQVAFRDLGHTGIAANLPGRYILAQVTADTLAAALDKAVQQHNIAPSDIADELGIAESTLSKYIVPGKWSLAADPPKALATLPNYAARREEIKASLIALGRHDQANQLPLPAIDAEELLGTLRHHAAQVVDAIGRMRANPELSARDAAQAVNMPWEPFSRVVARSTRGPRIRDPQSLVDELHNVQPWVRGGLDRMLERLNLFAAGVPVDDDGMIAVDIMSGKQGKRFIVSNEESLSLADGKTRITRLFARNPNLVMGPRTYGGDRARQLLRWISTVVNRNFPGGMEVQSYFDLKEQTLHISSNDNEVNEKVRQKLFSSAGLRGLASASSGGDSMSRETRHAHKLQNALSKSAANSGNTHVQQILAAIQEKRFKIPDTAFQSRGHPVYLHAERRISYALDRRTMNLDLLAGTKRPCGQCAAHLGFGPERRRGPFWLSNAASFRLDSDGIVQDNISNSIPTYVTKSRHGALTVDYNTESDSDEAPAVVQSRAQVPPADSRGARMSPTGAHLRADRTREHLGGASDRRLTANGVTLDPDTRSVWRADLHTFINLDNRQFAVLSHVMDRANRHVPAFEVALVGGLQHGSGDWLSEAQALIASVNDATGLNIVQHSLLGFTLYSQDQHRPDAGGSAGGLGQAAPMGAVSRSSVSHTSPGFSVAVASSRTVGGHSALRFAAADSSNSGEGGSVGRSRSGGGLAGVPKSGDAGPRTGRRPW
jgi:hypothetical protein